MKNKLFLFFYRAVLAPTGVFLAVTLGALFVPKVREGLRRRKQRVAWPSFSKAPLWIHASSGEFEYAKPLIREMKVRDPSLPIVVTYFSPTYAKVIESFPGVDLALPLPIDLPGPTRAFLNKLKPGMGLLARTDLWPELLHQARGAQIPMVLFSATRAKPPGVLHRWFLNWLYSYLSAIYCVSHEDAVEISKLSPPIPVVAIGDTRYDQVHERLRTPKALKRELQPLRLQTVILGSSWPEDEKVVFEALAPLLKSGSLQLILAPHEPTETHIKEIEDQLAKWELSSVRYQTANHFTAPVLIVDRVGILAELYQWASAAIIGGSFRGSVHSVMEALAAGCATFVGPFHRNNREALEFQNLCYEQTPFVQVAETALQLRQQIQSLLSLSHRPELQSKIIGEVDRRMGATLRLVESLEGPANPRPPEVTA